MRQGRRQALESDLPRRQIVVPESGSLDPHSLFDRPVDQVWLEIGAGNGDHAVWQAARAPHAGYLAAEPFLNGVARLLVNAEAASLDNLRILADDVRPLLDRLPAGSIDRCFILFPDPWPKRRHWRRRIVCLPVLARLAALMPPGAELRVATDVPDYLVWILRVFQQQSWFRWRATMADDWRRRPDDWPETRFEAKGREAGRASTYLSFRRADDGERA